VAHIARARRLGAESSCSDVAVWIKPIIEAFCRNRRYTWRDFVASAWRRSCCAPTQSSDPQPRRHNVSGVNQP
jgi:hypothetical protein